MAKIIIPTPLRKFTAEAPSIQSSGSTVLESIQFLTNQFPDLGKHIFDSNGQIRQFIRIYVGDEDINALDKENTLVSGDSIISIVPAIAGGIS